jgi:hypothetical protein
VVAIYAEINKSNFLILLRHPRSQGSTNVATIFATKIPKYKCAFEEMKHQTEPFGQCMFGLTHQGAGTK